MTYQFKIAVFAYTTTWRHQIGENDDGPSPLPLLLPPLLALLDTFPLGAVQTENKLSVIASDRHQSQPSVLSNRSKENTNSWALFLAEILLILKPSTGRSDSWPRR